jgi:hypothetical protein
MRGNSVSRCHIFPHHSHVLRPAVLRIKLEREERTGPGSELSWFALVLQQITGVGLVPFLIFGPALADSGDQDPRSPRSPFRYCKAPKRLGAVGEAPLLLAT